MQIEKDSLQNRAIKVQRELAVLPWIRLKYCRFKTLRRDSAVAGEQLTLKLRYRSTTLSRSRMKATHGGQASICFCISSQVTVSMRWSRYSDRSAKIPRQPWGRPPSAGFLRGFLAPAE